MDNKVLAVLAVLIVVVLSLFSIYAFDGGDKTDLAVYSEGPIPLSDIIDDIKNGSYYEGHDNETLAWMESLGDKQVFMGNGTIVVMNSYDASKIPSQYVTDVYIEEFIQCKVLENRSIGDVKYPKDVLLVDNVKYVGEEIHDLDGS